jgi:hypothetical protein
MAIETKTPYREWVEGATITFNHDETHRQAFDADAGYVAAQTYDGTDYHIEVADLSDGSLVSDYTLSAEIDDLILNGAYIWTLQNNSEEAIVESIDRDAGTSVFSVTRTDMTGTTATIAAGGGFGHLIYQDSNSETRRSTWDLDGNSTPIYDQVDNVGYTRDYIVSDGQFVLLLDSIYTRISVWTVSTSGWSKVGDSVLTQSNSIDVTAFKIFASESRVAVGLGPGDSDNTPSLEVFDLSGPSTVYTRSENDTQTVARDDATGRFVMSGNFAFSAVEADNGRLVGQLEAAFADFQGSIDGAAFVNSSNSDELVVIAHNGAVVSRISGSASDFADDGVNKAVSYDSTNGIRVFEQNPTGEIKTVL